MGTGRTAPGERIETLKEFFMRGIFTLGQLGTRVGYQPHARRGAGDVQKFVDFYKCGRANDLGPLTKQTDWRGYTKELIRVLRLLRKWHYIKEDLQAYLPIGYEIRYGCRSITDWPLRIASMIASTRHR